MTNTTESWVKTVEKLQNLWGTLPKNPRMNAQELYGTYNQITEELTEWVEAVEHLEKHGDTQESRDMLSDVIVDLVFYILQSGVRSGLTQDIEHRFHTVFQNNVNKLTDIQTAQETVKRLAKETQMTYSVREGGLKDSWLVIRDTDGKIMKPNGWKEI